MPHRPHPAVALVAFLLVPFAASGTLARSADASLVESAASDLADDGFLIDEQIVEMESGRVVPPIDAPALDGDDLAPEHSADDGHDHADLPRATLGADAAGATIVLDVPSEMVVIDTEGRGGSFALRSSVNGVWSDWVDVTASTDEAPDGLVAEEGSGTDVPAIGPIWVGAGSDAAGPAGAEAVEIIRLDGLNDPIRVEALAVTPEAAARDGAVEAPTASAIPGRPTIQPRSAWATRDWASGNETCGDGPLLARNVDVVIVHHTVTTNSYSADQVPALMRGIYRTHVDINGWCDIAYNFMVDRFGQIWEARSGGVDQPIISGATKGFNTASASVAVLGQFQSGANPPSAAPGQGVLDAIASLASWKLGLHGVDPAGTVWIKSRTSATSGLKFANGTWVNVPAIVGHRDLGLTSCPGSRLYPSLPSIRATVTAQRDGDVPYVFPSRRPLDSGPAIVSAEQRGGLRPAGAADTVSGAPGATTATVIAVDAVDGRGFQLLDTGAVRGFGGATAPGSNPAGNTAIVDLIVDSNGSAGWVLDVNGRLHGFNGADDRTPDTGALPGTAKRVELGSNGAGYVLDRSGGLHSIGGTPARTAANVASVDLALRSDGVSGWVLDVNGTLHPFGGAPEWQSALTGSSGNRARAVLADPTDAGGWVVDSEGRILSFGRPRHVQPNSTTVGAPVVADATLWWHLPSDLADTDDGVYTAAVVELFLRRPGSLAELDRWMWETDYRSRNEAVDQLARSPEWAGVIIDEIYLDVLGRAPDPEGQAYWVEQLSLGLRTQDLGALFYGSPEYVAAAGSNEAYVRRLYRALLDREPDSAGLEFWVGRLDAGTDPLDISSGFYQSLESRLDRVDRLYGQVLDRESDSGGRLYWADQLLIEDDIALARNLAVSDEFYLRAVGRLG